MVTFAAKLTVPLDTLATFTVLLKVVVFDVVVVKLKLPPTVALDPKVIVLLPDDANVVAASKVTGLLYVCAPLVVIAPCNCVVPPALIVKLLKPLTNAPLIVVVPLKLNVKPLPPPVMLV